MKKIILLAALTMVTPSVFALEFSGFLSLEYGTFITSSQILEIDRDDQNTVDFIELRNGIILYSPGLIEVFGEGTGGRLAPMFKAFGDGTGG